MKLEVGCNIFEPSNFRSDRKICYEEDAYIVLRIYVTIQDLGSEVGQQGSRMGGRMPFQDRMFR